jgi:hypothetical protein
MGNRFLEFIACASLKLTSCSRQLRTTVALHQRSYSKDHHLTHSGRLHNLRWHAVSDYSKQKAHTSHFCLIVLRFLSIPFLLGLLLRTSLRLA